MIYFNRNRLFWTRNVTKSQQLSFVCLILLDGLWSRNILLWKQVCARGSGDKDGDPSRIKPRGKRCNFWSLIPPHVPQLLHLGLHAKQFMFSKYSKHTSGADATHKLLILRTLWLHQLKKQANCEYKQNALLCMQFQTCFTWLWEMRKFDKELFYMIATWSQSQGKCLNHLRSSPFIANAFNHRVQLKTIPSVKSIG